MKKAILILAAMFVAAALYAVPASAQGIQIDANGGVYFPGGDDFDGTDAGFGGEVGVIYNFPSGFGLGVAGRRSNHNLDDTTGLTDSSFEVVGFLGVFRYAFPAQSITPYVEARAGYSDVTLEVSAGGVSAESSASGFEGGGIFGIAVPVGSKVDIDLSAMISFLDLGEFELGGVSLAGTESTGSVLGLRAGFLITTN